MSLYYFDVTDRNGSHNDNIGDEFVRFEQAREQIKFLLPYIIREELPAGDFHSVSCVLRDDAGKMIYRG